MRRPLSSRLLGVFMALWLSLTVGEPGALHLCPMHGGTPSPSHTGAATAHPQHAHGAAEHSAPARPHHAHGACTCLGACAVGGAVAFIAATSARIPAPRSIAQPVPRGLDRVRAAGQAPRLLPFANGPPAQPIAA